MRFSGSALFAVGVCTSAAATAVWVGDHDLNDLRGYLGKKAVVQPAQDASAKPLQQAAKVPDKAPDGTPASSSASPARKASNEKPAKPAGPKPSFDVIRVDPNGSSVFAGLARPNQKVVVLADGKPAGTVKSDADGNWVLVTDLKIAKSDAKFTVEPLREVASRVAADKKSAPVAVRSAAAEVAKGGVRKSDAPKAEVSKSVADVQNKMITRLEGMVKKAGTGSSEVASLVAGREREKAVGKVVNPQNGNPQKATPQNTDTRVASVLTAVVPKTAMDAVAATASPSVPVPVHFNYREATFTEAGRRAADLLTEYLKAKKMKRAVLSGHADDRGSDELNYALSEARLRAFDRHARKMGYTGELVLMPRGKTQPFKGIDRTKFSREELYQIDRRVELHLK